MKRFWKVAGIAALVAILGLMVVGAVALAQEEDVDSWPFQFREKLHEAIAGILGISVDEYDSAVDTARDQVLDEAVTSGWLTQDQADRMRERADEGWGLGSGPGMPPGFHGRRGGMPGLEGSPYGLKGGAEDSLQAIAADQLDITVEDLLAQLQDGETIAALAQEKGVDPQSIADTYLDNLSSRLDEAVQNERLTQERADWMREQARERVTEQMEATWPDCPHHGDLLEDGVMPGEMHRFPGGMWSSSS
jgi:hypothetical protein